MTIHEPIRYRFARRVIAHYSGEVSDALFARVTQMWPQINDYTELRPLDGGYHNVQVRLPPQFNIVDNPRQIVADAPDRIMVDAPGVVVGIRRWLYQRFRWKWLKPELFRVPVFLPQHGYSFEIKRLAYTIGQTEHCRLRLAYDPFHDVLYYRVDDRGY